MSGQFYVEANHWARWPKVLVMCKKTSDGTERRRYVPEGGTRDEWNKHTRETLHKLEATRKEFNTRLSEESELPNLQAEIDGLKWGIEERDALILDMWAFNFSANNAKDYAMHKNMIHERMVNLGIVKSDAQPPQLHREGNYDEQID